MLSLLGFKPEVKAYSRDLHLRTANQTIIKYHAHSLKLFSSRKELLDAIGQTQTKTNQGFIVPEFGFHSQALDGLGSLWTQLKQTLQSQATLFLEIGSGLTFLSALLAFADSQVMVCGIAVGESGDSFEHTIESKLKFLGINNSRLSKYVILDPVGKSRFGKKKKTDVSIMNQVFSETGIFIEPIYGVKTWEYFLHPELLPDNLPRPWFYLHQGGQLNHIDSRFFEGIQ
jgi:1-aminocyclopropane-1-carboxylate deaminase